MRVDDDLVAGPKAPATMGTSASADETVRQGDEVLRALMLG
jgi:hypothetical protein